jgi:potassium efflux system protein
MRVRRCCFVAVVIAVPACAAAVRGDDLPAESAAAAMVPLPAVEPGSPTAPLRAAVQTALRQIEEDAQFAPDVKRSLTDAYRRALEELDEADEHLTHHGQYEAARQNAPGEIERLKAATASRVAEASPSIDPRAPLEALKRSLAEAEDRAEAADDEREQLQEEQERRTERWKEVPALDERAAARLAELERQLEAAPLEEGPGAATARATRLLLESQYLNVAAERAAYAAELPGYEATRELLRLRLDDAVRRANAAEQECAAWKEAVELRSEAEAEAQAHAARMALITARPETLPLAEENERLTQLRQGPHSPAARLKEIRRNVVATQATLTKLRGEFARMKQTAELSRELGQLLLNQRRQLPDVAALEDDVEARKEEIAQVKLDLLDLETRRSELADLDQAVRYTLLPLEGALGSEELYELSEAVAELLTARRGYLDDLIEDQNALFNALVLEQDKTEQELLQTVRDYRTYVDEHILWVRSFPATLGWRPEELTVAAARLGDVEEWLVPSDRLWSDLRSSPQSWATFALSYCGLWWLVRRARVTIARLGDEVRQSYAADFLPTLRVTALTALCALPAPALLWFVASRLVAWPGTNEFVRAVAFAAKTTAAVWFLVALVRQALRRKGLADAHFGYPSTACDAARRMLFRLAVIGIPATAVAALAGGWGMVIVEASAGRTAFVLLMLCLCRAVHIVAHPRRGLLQLGRDDEDDRDDFRLRLRRLWYLAACAVPLALAALSAVGYHYTAVQLSLRLHTTLWLLVGFTLVRSLLLRALLMARKRLLWERARQPAAATSEAAATADKPFVPKLTLAVIDRQSRSLVTGLGSLALAIGVWCIWADMLPALKFLDRWQLYSHTVDSAAANSGVEAAAPKSGDAVRVEWITAADLAWAAIILTMAFIAARNLPGLLEIACLQWLPLDPGARYAATTVVRYLIHLATIIAVCNVVGLQWSSIQWLAAAVTVGLGFGLQEIFANFISGLIILFERPIRVGDVVTIGEVTGSVNRIRSRATTIVDGDRKEYIVPNKEFITGKLMNWTLSDDILRTVVRIVVSHDADVGRVVALLLEIAARNPLVLRDPEPTAACTQLGEQKLEIELRVFSAGPASLTPLRHQLNVAVLQAFHEAGIMPTPPSRERTPRLAPPSPPPPATSERRVA